MLTPRNIVRLLRACAAICGVALAVLMLGPFQGLERAFGLSDTSAHVIAFFAVTTGAFAIAPTWRRKDIALGVLAIAVISEILQGLTGRSVSVLDLAADALGITVAIIPGAIESLRRVARLYPDLTFAQIRMYDRRSAGRARMPAPDPAVFPATSPKPNDLG